MMSEELMAGKTTYEYIRDMIERKGIQNGAFTDIELANMQFFLKIMKNYYVFIEKTQTYI